MATTPITTSDPVARRARSWFPALDGLRAIGALAVVLTHVGFHSGRALNGWSAPLLSRLDVGVAIFFVLSGFLLYRPHAVATLESRSGPGLGRYLFHRVLRIVPAYWLAVTGAAVLLAENHQVSVETWIRTATFTQIYEPGHLVSGLTQMWSLATEVSFYVVLPLLAFLAARGVSATTPSESAIRRQAILVGLCMTISVAYLVVVGSGLLTNPTMPIWLPAYLTWFGLGMALAIGSAAVATGKAGRFTARSINLASAPGTTVMAAILLFALVATPIAGPRSLDVATGFESVAKNVLYAGIAGLLVFPAAFGDLRAPALRFLASRPLRFLGDISYGIFLYHLLVLELVRRWLHHETFSGDFWLLAALTIGITVPVSWLSYRLMERPLMRWGRHLRIG